MGRGLPLWSASTVPEETTGRSVRMRWFDPFHGQTVREYWMGPKHALAMRTQRHRICASARIFQNV